MSRTNWIRSGLGRRPGRSATSLVLLMTLVIAACGPRGDEEEGAAPSVSAEQGTLEQGTTDLGSGDQGATGVDATVPGQPAGAGAGTAVPAPGSSTPSASPSGQNRTGSAPAVAAGKPPGSAAVPAGGGGGTASGGGQAAPAAPSGAAAPAPTPGAPQPPSAPGDGRHTGPANLSPIAIGSICECSGPVGASLGSGIGAAQVTARYINDNGGLNGHPVRLFVGDSNSDPNRYFALVKQMVERDGVLAFMGQMSPLTVNAGDSYLREKGIPIVGGDGAHGIWFESPTLFYAGGSYRTMAVANAKYGVSLKKPKIGVVYCAEAQPCQIFHEALKGPMMSKAPGAEIVYEAQASLAQPDYTSECLQAQSRGVETMFVILDSAGASRFTRSCSQQGFNPQYITSPLTFTQSTADDPNNEGMVAAVATFPWFVKNTPAQQAYHAAVQRYKPNLQHSATTSSVWIAGQMMLEATKMLPQENPRSQDILKGVWTFRDNDFGGLAAAPASFPEGKPSVDSPCYFLLQIKKGAFVALNDAKPSCL